ncbi:unnamed protein product [Brachionus calyciflorus]|uniref:Uncharacterized protein n=1 Tax=Brachionus calyciflorus TaxID=104777 RepID=A0A813UJM0_9BILA|nr:unnamed protein product [Brachionus calyciflorus]
MIKTSYAIFLMVSLHQSQYRQTVQLLKQHTLLINNLSINHQTTAQTLSLDLQQRLKSFISNDNYKNISLAHLNSSLTYKRLETNRLDSIINEINLCLNDLKNN